MSRTIAAIVALLTAPAILAYGDFTSLAKLFANADRVVVAKVVKIEKIRDERWATAEVQQHIKGQQNVMAVRFAAEQRWSCDVTGAIAGERVLLFLVDARKDERIDNPPLRSYAILNSGRGRMRIRADHGEDLVIVDGDVALPKELIPADRALWRGGGRYRLSEILELLQRPLPLRGAFEQASRTPLNQH